MALINCPECEREISDQAQTCPWCGYPVNSEQSFAHATIVFDASSWKTDCYIYDMRGHEIASCRTGDTVPVYCSRPRTIQIKMSIGMGQPTIVVAPGETYKAWINGMGQVKIQHTTNTGSATE